MRNPIFDLAGGRKAFNAYLGVALVLLATQLNISHDALIMMLSLLGLTNIATAYEDSNKNEPVHVEPPVGTEVAPEDPTQEE